MDLKATTFSPANKPKLDDIIGIPPQMFLDYNAESGPTSYYNTSDNIMEDLVMAASPYVIIEPAWPKFGVMDPKDGEKFALQLYRLDFNDGRKRYKELLEGLGVPAPSSGKLIAIFQNENTFSEQFSQSYRNSSYEEQINSPNQLMSDLRFMSGGQNVGGEGGALNKLGNAVGEGKSAITQAMGGIIQAGAGAIGVVEDAAKSGSAWTRAMARGKAGSKVDFPKFWDGASCSMSYSIMIRLYNPHPEKETAHDHFIVKPLAWLLAFVIPINDSDDPNSASGNEETYHNPLLVRARAPGMFHIRAGYIESVDVVRGGDQNSFTFSQRPSVVDVRVTFNSIYDVVTAHTGENDRTSLGRYLADLRTIKKVGDPFGELKGNGKVITQKGKPNARQTLDLTQQKYASQRQYAQDFAEEDKPPLSSTVTPTELDDVFDSPPTSRVDAQIMAISNSVVNPSIPQPLAFDTESFWKDQGGLPNNIENKRSLTNQMGAAMSGQAKNLGMKPVTYPKIAMPEDIKNPNKDLVRQTNFMAGNVVQLGNVTVTTPNTNQSSITLFVPAAAEQLVDVGLKTKSSLTRKDYTVSVTPKV